MMFQWVRVDNHPKRTLLGRGILFLILIVFTVQLTDSERPWIILDGVNFLFHEAGHLLFSFFGETVGFLGGTLNQLLMPSLILGYFLYKQELFSAAFALFWLGDNFINISFYIKDASTMTLPLFGGGIHDWNWLLTNWGILESDWVFGNIVYILGLILIVYSLSVMAFLILNSLANSDGKKFNKAIQ